MLQYKQKSLIPDIVADKKLNAAANKAVDADKRRYIAIDKKLNTIADKGIDADNG